MVQAAAWLSPRSAMLGLGEHPVWGTVCAMGVLPAAMGRGHRAAGLALPEPGIAAQWGCVTPGGQNCRERKMPSLADHF